MDHTQLRQQLLSYAQQLSSSGLSVGKSGNISVRCDEGFLITATGIDYQQMSTRDLVHIYDNGEIAEHQHRLPSSEWHFHCDIYQSQPETQAIVHAHPIYSTALACTGREIPAFHYMVAVAGGDNIPIADYALFGTEELSAQIQKVLQHRQACLLANHGMIATGSNLNAAFQLAIEVETLAQQYCEALKIGNVTILSKQQMQQVLHKFQHYGQRL